MPPANALPPAERDVYARFYALVAEEEDARVCRDIPDDACREQPAAFSLQLLSQILTKLGDALTSSRIVLAWMLASLAAPAIYISLLVPVRESLSLLPQLFIAQAVRQRRVRKGFWVAGSVAQALCLCGMLPAILFLEGHALGSTIIALLAAFSLARGVCSVAAKDVLGKTVSKSRRGRLGGLAGSVAGLITLAVAAGLMLYGVLGGERPDGDSALFIGLLGASAVAWLLAAALYSRVPEVEGATEGGGNAITEAIASLSLLRSDRDFRDFVIARILLVATAFAIPYVVLILREAGNGDSFGLGALLLAEGLAGLLSAPFWGWWSDSASHRVMAAGALISVTAMLATLGAGQHAPDLLGSALVGGGLIFLCAVAHQGARIGRKTYLVDLADGDNRAAYTAVSNTVLGLFLFSGAGLGLVDAAFGTRSVLWLLVGIGVLAILRSVSLRRVD
jgi:predicted MFS family arabinose efflux permease